MFPRYDAAKLRKALENQSRGPYVELLARFLESGPSDDAVQDEAEKYPNRWVQNIQMLTRAAGYRDQVDVASTELHMIANLSDAELTAYLASLDIPTKGRAHEQPDSTDANEVP